MFTKVMAIRLSAMFTKIAQSSFFISLIELDEYNKIKLSKIARLDKGLNPGRLHNSQAC